MDWLGVWVSHSGMGATVCGARVEIETGIRRLLRSLLRRGRSLGVHMRWTVCMFLLPAYHLHTMVHLVNAYLIAVPSRESSVFNVVVRSSLACTQFYG